MRKLLNTIWQRWNALPAITPAVWVKGVFVNTYALQNLPLTPTGHDVYRLELNGRRSQHCVPVAITVPSGWQLQKVRVVLTSSVFHPKISLVLVARGITAWGNLPFWQQWQHITQRKIATREVALDLPPLHETLREEHFYPQKMHMDGGDPSASLIHPREVGVLLNMSDNRNFIAEIEAIFGKSSPLPAPTTMQEAAQ